MSDSKTRRVEVHPGREVIVEFDPDLTFECVDRCTWCCHHGVLLYGQDLEQLANYAPLTDVTTRVGGEPFVRKQSKDRDGYVGEDGCACSFLDDDGLCSLHRDHDWKPTRCSVFPLEVFRDDEGLHVDVRQSAREHCEGLNVSERRVIDSLEAFLPPALWELEDPDTERIVGY